MADFNSIEVWASPQPEDGPVLRYAFKSPESAAPGCSLCIHDKTRRIYSLAYLPPTRYWGHQVIFMVARALMSRPLAAARLPQPKKRNRKMTR